MVRSLTSVLAKIFFFFFLALTPKTEATKAKINKWDSIRLKIYRANRTNKVKRQPTEQEEIFANQKYIKNTAKTNINKQSNLKMGRGFE